MGGFAVDRMGGFHHGFAESRVGMDGFAEFAGRDLQMHCRTGFRHQVGGMRADHVDAEDLIGLGIGNDLAETGGVVDLLVIFPTKNAD